MREEMEQATFSMQDFELNDDESKETGEITDDRAELASDAQGTPGRQASAEICSPREEGSAGEEADPSSAEPRYRGVARRDTRWRASLKWSQTTFSLGTYDNEVQAARAYDLACICVGRALDNLNFGAEEYEGLRPWVASMTIEEFSKRLRKLQGQTLQPDVAEYMGVQKRFKAGQSPIWKASIEIAGLKVNIGRYGTAVEAAQAYDQACMLRNAHGIGPVNETTDPPVLNFPQEHYLHLLADDGSEDQRNDAAFAASQAEPLAAILAVEYAAEVIAACEAYQSL